MKTAFFGTPDFAVPTLQRLIESPRHEVVCVFTQPDKPAGRGRKVSPPPVKEVAEAAGIPVYQPESVRGAEVEEILRQSGAEIAVVIAYGKILPAGLLRVPRLGFVNVHASLLPKYRGAAPIQWAIVRGERETGVTIMQVTEGLDAGPIIAQESVEILEDDDARSLFNMLSYMGADLMLNVLDEVEEHGHFHAHHQDESLVTHAPLVKREDARIDWTAAPETIICLVRGFVMWPVAHTMLDGQTLKITAAEAVDPAWVEVNWKDERIEPGTVVDYLKGRGLVVKAGEGLLLLTKLKFEGKSEMDAASAVNGGLIKIGTRLV